jgi:undecaprenyl-diphosphatase
VNYLVPALLGILQGLTEFLPVSSTAHLLIAGELLRFEDPGEAFTVMIQLGAILAVIWLYRAKILSVLAGLPTNPDARRFVLMVLVAFAPALVAGALLNDVVEHVLADSPTVIAVAFIAGGIVMLAVESMRPSVHVRQADQTPLVRALAIGICQMVALIPGVSRSGATIVGARLLGLERAAAAEFSFFLAIPTMMAAFVFKLFDTWAYLTPERGAGIAVGFAMAFVAALVIVKPFLSYVSRAGFAPFAWYRIVAGIVLLAAVAAGWLP